MPRNNAEPVPQLVNLIMTKEAMKTVLKCLPGVIPVQIENRRNGLHTYVLTPTTIPCQTFGTSPESGK